MEEGILSSSTYRRREAATAALQDFRPKDLLFHGAVPEGGGCLKGRAETALLCMHNCVQQVTMQSMALHAL